MTDPKFLDGSYEFPKETTKIYKNGVLHCEDGPAVRRCYRGELFFEKWYQNGLLHREDGPAVRKRKRGGVFECKWYQNGKLHRENGPAVECGNWKEYWLNGCLQDGKQGGTWYKNGKLHREDGPTLKSDSLEQWHYNGKLHRIDGPAYTHKFGPEDEHVAAYWFRHGRLHRKDGPAITIGPEGQGCHSFLYNPKDDLFFRALEFGEQQWWLDGRLHRKDGPAIEREDGTKVWYKNGRPHREDGPAVIYPNGSQEWWRDGGLHKNDGPAVVPAEGYYLDFYYDEYDESRRLVNKYKTFLFRGNERPVRPLIPPELVPEPLLNSNNSFLDKFKSVLCRAREPKEEPKHILTRASDPYFIRVYNPEWWLHGKPHREDGPARIEDSGEKRWFQHGKLHREDGPAVEHPNGTEEWWLNGKLHREGGPAIDIPEGYCLWHQFKYDKYGEYGAPKRLREFHRMMAKEYRISDGKMPKSDFAGQHFGQEWWVGGKLHREDGPAIEYQDPEDTKSYMHHWYLNGQCHREGGPAIDIQCGRIHHPLPNQDILYGDQQWWRHGKLHREGAAAVISSRRVEKWFFDGKLHRKDGPAVIFHGGSQEWWLDGRLHRENGPAVDIPENCQIRQYKVPRVYRGSWTFIVLSRSQAVEVQYIEESNTWNWLPAHTGQEWWIKGKLHREGAPAIIRHDGEERWFLDGVLHREDGPAVTYGEGSMEWWSKGKLHRIGGPAVDVKKGRILAHEYKPKLYKKNLEHDLQLQHRSWARELKPIGGYRPDNPSQHIGQQWWENGVRIK